MSKNKKVMGATAVAASSLALLLGTTAFAAVPTTNGTVMVGTTAYSMDYLMNLKDAAQIKSIQSAIAATATSGNLYYSLGQGTWKDVMTGTQSMTENQLATKLGVTTVTYVKADGTTTNETVGTATSALSVSSVSAINAKTLKVTFSAPVADTSKVTFGATRDGAPVSFSTVTWNDSKTEAQLAVSYKLFAGVYSVTAKVDTTTLVGPSATVADEKIAKISFTSDKAILASDSKSITAGIKVENQYGEDITKNYNETSLKILPSRTDAVVTPTLSNGTITVTAPVAPTGTFAVDEKVVVTVVDPSGTTSSQTLTCASAVDIASVSLGDVTTDETDKTIYVATDLSSKDYWLPLTVKDQYGNEITDLPTLKSNLTVLSSDKNIMDDFVANDIVLKNGKPAIKLKDGNTSPAAKAGIVTITVASKSGKAISKSVEVKEDAKTDVFTLSQPEDIVKSGVPVVIPFTAADQYGNALTKAENGLAITNGTDTLTLGSGSNKTTIKVSQGTIAGSIDYINGGKLVIKVTPNDATQKLVIVVTTATAKVQTLTLGVQAAPVAKTISGLKSTFYTAYQEGQFKDNVAPTSMVSLKDQYGNAVGLGTNTLTVAAVDSTNTNMVIGAGTGAGTYKFTATSAKNGTAQFTATLKDSTGKTLDTYTFSMENVALKNVTQFAIEDMGKFYTGTDFFAGAAKTDYDKTLTFVGKKADGTKVLVDPTLVKGATSTTPINLDLTNIATGTIKVINATDQVLNAIDTKAADKTSTITFTMQGVDAPISVTKDMAYSNAKPVAQSLSVIDPTTLTEITDPVVEEYAANLAATKVLGTDTAFQFLALDQYDVAAAKITYTVTNVTDANVVAGSLPSISISNAGVITSANLSSGDSFVITASIDGFTKSLKVIVK